MVGFEASLGKVGTYRAQYFRTVEQTGLLGTVNLITEVAVNCAGYVDMCEAETTVRSEELRFLQGVPPWLSNIMVETQNIKHRI
jgi:hypothetical protein